MARNSKIILSKNIKLDKEYKNVLDYSETEMLSLINENKVAESNSYSFIRVDENKIKVGWSYNDCVKGNYIAFQNPTYNNKWFFAFVDRIEYLSDNASIIYYTIDVHSTWFDYWDPKACYIIREHVTDDTVGIHTFPEQIEVGDYVIDTHITDPDMGLEDLKIVIGSTVAPSDPSIASGGEEYNGIFSGVGYYTYDKTNTINNIKSLNENQKSSAISSIFLAPSFLVPNQGGSVTPSSEPVSHELTITRITELDGYTPKNKKLLCYPYCYILVTNGNSSSAIYKPELFAHDTLTHTGIKFKVYGSLTPGCSIRIVPEYYKNLTGDNFDEGINLGKFPQCNWATDAFTNWLTQNGVNVVGNIATGIGMTALGLGSGRPIVAGSGAVSLFNSAREVYMASKQPPQLNGNTNCGDVITSMGQNNFHIYTMTMKEEYARKADDYLSRVGYICNRIKLPNITGRQYYNYVQIGSEEEIGYSTGTKIPVPKEFMNVINDIYRNGTTVWHAHVHVGNYALDNSLD